MSKGENIFKRKDGRWEARYVKGRDLSGKIKYGFCYGKTYREAKEKVTKLKASVVNGKFMEEGKIAQNFAFYCDEWLRNSKSRIKESTYIKYDTILECHIKPKFGACNPSMITTGALELFSNELLNKEAFAPKTVKDILVVLRSVLRYISKQTAGNFPAVEIIYPKEPRKEMRVLSMEEQRSFILYLMADMDSCKFGILLALYTGIRVGELCALQWKNISLEERYIKITATMQRLKDVEREANSGETISKTRVVIGSPKSDTSMRTIPITGHVSELCMRMKPLSGAAYVLTGTADYMEPRTLQYRFRKYTTECGLKDVHFHTLRHTFATRCVEVGFEIKSLSEILGHSTTTVTLERYVHSSMALKRDNMNKLETMGL